MKQWAVIALAIVPVVMPVVLPGVTEVPIARADDPVEQLDVPGLDAADLRGDALVWEDAAFYLEPWEGATTVRFASFGRGRREEVGRAVPVRIVDSSMRSFVEIQLTNRAECTWRRLEADKRLEGLRLFVRRDDLAPVLVKPFSAQYSDGTKIKLGVGVPVMPTASGDYIVAAREDKLRLPIPHGSVGYLYKPAKLAADADGPIGKVLRIDRNTNAKVGEESFAVRSAWLAPVVPTKTDVALVHWTTRCVDMVASVPATALRPTEVTKSSSWQPTPTTTPSTPAARTPWIPPGVPLATPGGREVAVATQEIAVSLPTAPGADGTQICFDARLSLVREDAAYATSQRTLKLCAPAGLIER
ncbi:MAG TPA: hypothetical protein VFQ53_03910 [Kofleriaceae bacterium]|nr:hypothetical protein [Kofleriaceae bacterium]